MWDLMRYYFTNTYAPTQPAVVLASVPLGTVSEVSHAMSQNDLKFRAAGGVFLAHQEGGDVSLRLRGKAWGKNRFIFLSILDFLFLYGSAKTVDLFSDFLKNPMAFLANPRRRDNPGALARCALAVRSARKPAAGRGGRSLQPRNDKSRRKPARVV